ncbi:unnamed protein product [Tetraodon nigroviridis]|uniref:(spotted green pufferfish) hypothetical protein n=1 Tax=Tetraodon nigroviridis TaxID=99883 RepID=Q4T8W4_TETNG|nr:unnamed protein product [Tetraodon nigroviridis]
MTPVQAFALLAAALLTTASAAVLPPSQHNSSQEQRAARAWTLHQEDNSTRSDSSRLEDLRIQEELQNSSSSAIPICPLSPPHLRRLQPGRPSPGRGRGGR